MTAYLYYNGTGQSGILHAENLAIDGIKGFSRGLMAVCSSGRPSAFGHRTRRSRRRRIPQNRPDPTRRFRSRYLYGSPMARGPDRFPAFRSSIPTAFRCIKAIRSISRRDPMGSSSADLYLNTLSYRLADPLDPLRRCGVLHALSTPAPRWGISERRVPGSPPRLVPGLPACRPGI